VKPRPRIVWRPIAPEPTAALARALARWDGTPYVPGAQARGAGVDCVRFVAAVLDELRRRVTPIETLPNDAALHAPGPARAAMLRLRRAYGPSALVHDDSLEPGDVVVTGVEGGGPGHALIAGDRPNVLWESPGQGVRRVGLSALRRAGVVVFAVYRPTDKPSWRSPP
jgi:cell wall-associated NlpC family hydrolase